MSELKITDVRILKVKGSLPFEGEEYWEERLVRPVDIYPEYKTEGPRKMKRISSREVETESSFVEITTDGGITGIANSSSWLSGILQNFIKPILVGKDPFATEKLWDQLYRFNVHGRKCWSMIAQSQVDCALWDIIGKVRKEPVYRLLGGPVKEKIRAYASCLGYSLEPKRVTERAQRYVDEGYTAMKWFFRWGPSDGVKGEEKNIELAKTLRDAVGYDVEIMLDCWQSWNVKYTIRMARKLERYEPTWLEEPVLGDMVDEMAEIKAAVDIPISGAEHEYTRWGFMNLAKKNALDIWQPDVTWAGGISEVTKICAIASSVGIPVVPHSGNAPISQHIWFSQNIATVPIAEYLVKWNPIHQAFQKEQLTPKKGFIYPWKNPGLGIELDESKIEEKTYIHL
ncbi:mandelate racemase/muconate lactonizing protein [Candidatus Bathyarchaeota archaeon]|nr:mandelate racemase/muconate lactonizing protein [Candidatus Bathyarchaeota archaeon]